MELIQRASVQHGRLILVDEEGREFPFKYSAALLPYEEEGDYEQQAADAINHLIRVSGR